MIQPGRSTGLKPPVFSRTVAREKAMTKDAGVNQGPPDIEIAGLQIWIQGYQYPEADDEYDANWLKVSAHCGAFGASVWVSGTLLSTSDITTLAAASEQMYHHPGKKCEVDPREPGLRLAMRSTDSYGHLELTVDITPDHLYQHHTFRFDIDQSYLPSVVEQSRRVLGRFPCRQR